ncbi:MAG TPA: serine protease [Casimicrobiaceae bacterium]|nr:serine protease [Casimicrobiaceae bacterium]
MAMRWVACLAFALYGAEALAQIVAVPPAVHRASPTAKSEPVPALLTPAGAPALMIALPAPTAAEKAQREAAAEKRAAASSAPGALPVKRRVLAVGFARAMPDGDRPLAMATMPWQALADGGMAARINLSSPGAAAIRIGVTMSRADPGIALRFVGAADPQHVFGPFTAREVATSGLYWSPVLEGDSATLEIYLPRGVAPTDMQLTIPTISHLVLTGNALQKNEPVDDIGTSRFCEVDVACVGTTAALNQTRAVAKLLFTEGGFTFLCTGTLLNDSIASNTPYLYTASHCIDSQEAAGSLVTYWFFDALACGDRSVPPYKTVTGGAVLLGRSVDSDWALVRLKSAPPANAVFSAWRAEALPDFSTVTVLHHPKGDLKKISSGSTLDYFSFSDNTSFADVRYSSGSTEPGSSGAGLLTLGSNGNFYELRGGLFAGDAACSNTSGDDVYSRLDVAMPLLAQYLTPAAANPSKKTLVVEYYYAVLDDYFITANELEIQGLDNGVHLGWGRTGLTFLAYADPTVAPVGASPVCRFYLLPTFGDSHFYSADPAECAATAVKFAGSWVEESPALFYIQLPDRITGACPANTRPVYRFLNQLNQIHHRYTAEIDVRNCMYHGINITTDKFIDCTPFAGVWLEEGYGTPPNAPVMCSPAS